MIPAGTECRKATTTTMIPATVAPASGIRSRIATSRPSATAYGTPRASSTIVIDAPAIRLIRRFPVT
jgi:hypothetical protein